MQQSVILTMGRARRLDDVISNSTSTRNKENFLRMGNRRWVLGAMHQQKLVFWSVWSSTGSDSLTNVAYYTHNRLHLKGGWYSDVSGITVNVFMAALVTSFNE